MGANVSIAADNGLTALHASTQGGYLAVSKMLMEAGAGLEAATTGGCTPLRMAAWGGHVEVMSALIDAGANPDGRRKVKEATPLFVAAQEGHKDAIKVLLRAGGNPLLIKTCVETGKTTVPLDMAAQRGHLGGRTRAGAAGWDRGMWWCKRGWICSYSPR